MPEWISVKDRLPEKSGYYLVHLKCDSLYRARAIMILPYNNVIKEWYDTNSSLIKLITHWKPLSEEPNI